MGDRSRRSGAEEISCDHIALASATDRVSNNGVILKTVDYQPTHRAVARIDLQADSVACHCAIELNLQYSVETLCRRVGVRSRPRLRITIDSHRLRDNRQRTKRAD